MTQTQPPLDQPLHGASLPQAVSRFFRKYATFSGRASRSEYWWVYLFIILVSLVGAIGLGVLGNATQTPADRAAGQPGAGSLIFGVPLIIFWLAIIVPAIALHVRRLHDVNFSGLLYLITFVPYLGSLVLLIFALLPSNPAGARFDAGAAPAGYPPTTPGYTPAPPVQAGPPPQATPPPVAPPADPPTS
jgi:uncharacterized membrane protein YhaH (DUF805 family)